MRALSLWEPWATFIAKGWKTIETRSWSTPYRGPIAIHAAKTKKCLDGDEVLGILEDAGLKPQDLDGYRFPLGCIVATAVLERCVSSEDLVDGNQVNDRNRVMGDFSPGRFGWLLAEVKPLLIPVPLVGQQGCWELGPEVLEVLAGRAPVPSTPMGRMAARARFEKQTPLFPEEPTRSGSKGRA
jgi:activating signal cointegrator 1